ncbi:MAG: flippase-like domain-containing protein [Chloroflexi bacterium]|nr:flippase-like domain-containing protein [Chloroflexota bacterium]
MPALGRSVTQGRTGRGAVRVVLGIVVSAVFVVLTISRVDLVEVGAAFGRVNFSTVLLAVPVVGLELLLRAIRWQRLLQPIAPVALRRTVAYLAIGYFANSMLPARLGDVARAFLAGQAFGISRLTVLGTIVVERLADGLFILAVVAILGLTVAGGASLASTALWLGVLGIGGLAVLVVALAWVRRPVGGRIRTSVRSFVERLLRGVEGLRSPAVATSTAALTIAAFGAAVVMFAVIAGAANSGLTLAQSALVMGGLALSTSIPAGPSSIGTYEFVGLTILTSLGLAPEPALAIVVIVHLVATLPVALAGLIATWQFHFRFSEIAQDAEPANLAAEPISEAT